ITSSIAKQIAEAEAGRHPATVHHGSLAGERDFIDVADAVEALMVASELTCAGGQIFNVGTGIPVPVARVFDFLMESARCRLDHVVDPQSVTDTPATRISLDSRLLTENTGWRPKVELERSLTDTLEY